MYLKMCSFLVTVKERSVENRARMNVGFPESIEGLGGSHLMETLMYGKWAQGATRVGLANPKRAAYKSFTTEQTVGFAKGCSVVSVVRRPPAGRGCARTFSVNSHSERAWH